MREWVLILFLVGCGAAETPPPVGTTSVEVPGWPSIPFVPNGVGLRALLDLNRQLDPLPAATGASWVREVHSSWIERRAQLLAHASDARRVLRGGPAKELGVGAAVHGHILLQTANQLEDANLQTLSPPAAAAVRAPVFDLRERASAAFGVCVEHIQTPELDGWRDGCRTRMRSLTLAEPN